MKLQSNFKHLADKFVLMGCALLCVLAVIVGSQLENSLLPPVKRPEVGVMVQWPGKSVEEIEQTLIAPLEQVLAGLPNNIVMESNVLLGSGSIRLEFKSGTDMERTYLETLNRVNQVPGWPANVRAPAVVNYASGASATLASAMLYSKGAATKDDYIQAFNNYIQPALSKVQGVAGVVTGNNAVAQRIEVVLDTDKLKAYGISLEDVRRQLLGLNDRSGDFLTLGERRYALYFKGQKELDELKQLPIFYQDPVFVSLGDVAHFNKTVEQDWSYSSIQGHKAFYLYFTANPDVNVLSTLTELKQEFAKLNQGVLADLEMELLLSRDDSKAVKSAINQVYTALVLGVLLSSLVLFYFLRQWSTVGLIFVTIPVCLSFVIVLLSLFGYSLNVISLAGMALSVGLILDAGIVVTESIQQQRQGGKPLTEAVAKGTYLVRGAILSSTFSSIVIFVPILLMETPEAQLFEDLAFTLSSALFMSLLAALLLLPVLARKVLVRTEVKQVELKRNSVWISKVINNSKLAQTIIIAAVPLAMALTVWLLPNMNVLPQAKNRSVHAFVSYQDPLSPEAAEQNIAQPIISRLQQELKNGTAPKYDLTGLFCWPNTCLMYFYPDEDWDYSTFSTWVKEALLDDIPGTSVFVMQENLLRFALPNSGISQLDIQGGELSLLQKAGSDTLAKLKQAFPEARIDPVSELQNRSVRIAFEPNHQALLRYGIDLAYLNRQLETLTQGTYLGRYNSSGQSLPFYLKAANVQDLEQLLTTEILIPQVGLRPLSELTTANFVTAPSRSLRINQRNSVTLNLVPPEGVSQSEFNEQVRTLLSDVFAEGEYSKLTTTFRGSADRLDQFITEFIEMFLFSLVILFGLLRMSLSNWKQASAVVLSMPLAILGGVLSLRLFNLFTPQPLDVLTLIGFIILMGLVINNAILLVNQFEQGVNSGLNQQEAVSNAVLNRKRAVYMSSFTSILGMLPLMLIPGDGAEIYRGLAAVIVGGMMFSAMFTLYFMAALLSRRWFTPSQRVAGIKLAA